jgi:CMP-N-acetylneuraminic acid synthetase
MSRALEQDPGLALVFPDYFYVDADGIITGQERRHDFDQVTLLDQPAHGACSLARRDNLLEVGAYSTEITCQDGVDLWLKIVGKFAVKNINLPLFYYRRHGQNLTEQSDRILRQRAEIFRRHIERGEHAAIDVVAVVPIRGPSVDPRDPTLLTLGDKTLLDWTLEAALAAREIKDVVVTTPCLEVSRHVAARYGDRVGVQLRDRQSAAENVSFEAAVAAAVTQQRVGRSTPDAVMELTVQFPFREAFTVDKAVNALRLFGVDRVVSVLPEDDFIYQHDGNSLIAVGGASRVGGLRLEREYLYRQAGGIMLRRAGRDAGRMGHVVVSRRASFRVRDAQDIALARGLM